MQFRSKPKVAVFMVTYNHGNYIEQAIEGVLKQETDFPFKFFIGEDFSPDNTREICRRYKERFPDIIELTLHPQNIGSIPNSFAIMEQCFAYGKYTAICEGDDYWTDPLKLQKQIDFLEANPDFAVCHHNLQVIYENKDASSSHLFYSPNSKPKDVATFEDAARSITMAMPSCVFRSNLFDKFPDWYEDVLCPDYALHLLNSQHGKIKYLDEVMSVYRVHDNGIWSGKDEEVQLLGFLDAIRKCREYFMPRATEHFNAYEIMMWADLCFLKFEKKDYKDFRRCYRDLVSTHKFSINHRLLAALTARYLSSYTPRGINFFKRLLV